MKPKSKDKGDVSVEILEMQRGCFEAVLVGTTPMFMNAMSEKAKHELLFPSLKKKGSAKAATLKHEPMDEFQGSVYRSMDANAETLLVMPSTAFKAALKAAAVDMPDTAKAQIGRLTYVEGTHIPIYGVPKIAMSVVRMADQKRTPDIRTRCVIPEWTCRLRISFVKPILKEQSVVNLLAAAGITIGIGDWRSEKGAGNYGSYELVGMADEKHARIVVEGGRAAQVEAMENPEAFDSETANLLTWFEDQKVVRGFVDRPKSKAG